MIKKDEPKPLPILHGKTVDPRVNPIEELLSLWNLINGKRAVIKVQYDTVTSDDIIYKKILVLMLNEYADIMDEINDSIERLIQ